MGSRTLAWKMFGLLTLIAASWLTSGPLPAQVRIAREAMVESAEIDVILGVGQQLEQQSRWGEALTHYEEALRRHPGSPDLVHRHFLARLHYDVARRYSDTSFVAALEQLDEQQAVDLYAEILLKIHAYYVTRIDWKELLERGAVAMEVALDDDRFQQTHRCVLTREQRDAFLAEIERRVQTRTVASRHAAREAVVQVAELAGRYLGIAPRTVVLEYACAAASSLDDYSAFLTGSQLDEVLSQIEGNFVGLGIELKAAEDSLMIVNVIPGGPADRAGIRPGERIVRVDGHAVEEITADAAADMLRGDEGSRVQLVIDDAAGQQRYLRLTRMRVEVSSVEKVSILDEQQGIAYLRLTSFQKKTSQDVEAALWSLHRQGMRSLILDVRGNPGGLLTSAVEVADKFVAEGRIVSTRGRSSGEDRDFNARMVGTWRVPLVVLIDGDSASASEIFAGAIRDHGRGYIVGHRSYGKGSVQGIFPLNIANVGIRLTTAKFYSPSGRPISRRGVEPNVPVRVVARLAADGQETAPDADPILQSALQVARRHFGQP